MTNTLTSLEERLNGMAQQGLQQWFESQVRTLPHLPCPPKILVINDLHAGDGGIGKHIDPLKASGMEPAILDLLDIHQDYVWVCHEVWDIWRGYTEKACQDAHDNLYSIMINKSADMEFLWLDSNHSKDELILPPAFIMEGYNKKFFFFHGHDPGDWPNSNEGWKIGRWVVRAADELGKDPMSSPHPSSSDRHVAVREMWKKLADDNPEWTFVCGHSYFQEYNGYWNSGSPLNGKLEYITIEEGEIQLHG